MPPVPMTASIRCPAKTVPTIASALNWFTVVDRRAREWSWVATSPAKVSRSRPWCAGRPSHEPQASLVWPWHAPQRSTEARCPRTTPRTGRRAGRQAAGRRRPGGSASPRSRWPWERSPSGWSSRPSWTAGETPRVTSRPGRSRSWSAAAQLHGRPLRRRRHGDHVVHHRRRGAPDPAGALPRGPARGDHGARRPRPRSADASTRDPPRGARDRPSAPGLCGPDRDRADEQSPGVPGRRRLPARGIEPHAPAHPPGGRTALHRRRPAA